MKYIDFSDATPAEHLAADEAVLDLCEAGSGDETLLFWESRQYFVVIGYANQAAREANLPVCAANGIPVFRRCTGGGTVLQGPGCLNYSLVLRIKEGGPTQGITSTNHFILQRHQAALQPLVQERVRIEGHTDLALENLKFSGNAQRRKKQFLIFHGTFLLEFDLPLIGKYLRMPSKQPEYRQERGHAEFLTNLRVPAEAVKSALRQVWGADDVRELPEERVRELGMEVCDG